MFDTWGPYTCETYDAAGIDGLWAQFRTDPEARVEDGVGVYVVGVEGADGRLVPWYVGQTYTSFGGRLKQHFDKGRFNSISGKGAMKLILIARTKDGRIIPRQSGRAQKLDRKVIDWLEVDLIDKCRVVNRQLLNRQFVKFLDSIWVGGYRGEGALDPKAMMAYPAYSLLAGLLKLI